MWSDEVEAVEDLVPAKRIKPGTELVKHSGWSSAWGKKGEGQAWERVMKNG